MPTHRISVNDYEVEIFPEPGDVQFDHSYINADYWTSPILVRVYKDEDILKAVLIGSCGGGTSVHETSFIVEPDRIVLCCSDSIFCLSIPDLELLWRTPADSATCFEIFKYHDSYIIHGELEITRLDKNGKILWQQSGADIFTSLHSEKGDFLITDDYIMATDWDRRKYKFDFNGNIIS
jgi:outer membrane protein assembly factor BamB